MRVLLLNGASLHYVVPKDQSATTQKLNADNFSSPQN